MTRYQWLLVALLSANFGVVFFDRNTFSYLASFIQQDLELSNFADRQHRRGLFLQLGDCRPVHGQPGGPVRAAQADAGRGHLVFSLASVLSGFASAFVALLGARLLMGVAEGGIMPITQTLIAADVPHERRGLAQGITQNFGANLLANTLGPLVIVWMAVSFGWRNAFFLAADARPDHGVADRHAGARTRVRAPAAQAGPRRLRAHAAPIASCCCALLISTLLVAYLVVFFTFTPLYLIQVRGFDQQQMSWIMSSFGVASMAVAFLVPGSSDRFGRKPVIFAAVAAGSGAAAGPAVHDWHAARAAHRLHRGGRGIERRVPAGHGDHSLGDRGPDQDRNGTVADHGNQRDSWAAYLRQALPARWPTCGDWA